MMSLEMANEIISPFPTRADDEERAFIFALSSLSEDAKQIKE